MIIDNNNCIFNLEAQRRTDTSKVNLKGTFLQGRRNDLPTMLWFSDLVEPAENFETFFRQEGNKVLDVRNVWLLNIRNMGDSDHHESFDMAVSISHSIIYHYSFIGHLS